MICNICGYSFDYDEEYDLDDWDRPAHIDCLDELDYYDGGYDY